MNGNTVGAKTLAYLRGEKDLLQEKEQFSQVRKQSQNPGLLFGLSAAQKRRVERFWQVASLLHENSRMSLCEMSRMLKLPVSTLFETLKEVEKYFLFTIVLKEKEKDAIATDPSPFELAYQVTIDTTQEDGSQMTLD